ncbi:hypothetical protein M2267_002573 [Ensifer sp. KUDG1]
MKVVLTQLKAPNATIRAIKFQVQGDSNRFRY